MGLVQPGLDGLLPQRLRLDERREAPPPHVGHEPVPEGEVGVGEPVLDPLRVRAGVLGDRRHALDDAHVEEPVERALQRARLLADPARDPAPPPLARGDGLDDGVVDGGVGEEGVEGVGRLVVEPPRRVEHVPRGVLPQRPLGVDEREVAGEPAEHGVEPHLVANAPAGCEAGRVEGVERPDVDARRAPSVKGLVGPDEPVHRAHVAPAQHERDARVGCLVVPPRLEDGREGGGGAREVGELVEDERERLARGPLDDVLEDGLPVGQRDAAERGVVEPLSERAADVEELLALGLPRGLDVETAHGAGEPREEEALPGPPTADDEDEARPPLLDGPDELGPLAVAVEDVGGLGDHRVVGAAPMYFRRCY